MNRGDAAAGTLLFRGDGATARPRRGYSVETGRRRGRDVDIPWRRAATARPRRGRSVETGARRALGTGILKCDSSEAAARWTAALVSAHARGKGDTATPRGCVLRTLGGRQLATDRWGPRARPPKPRRSVLHAEPPAASPRGDVLNSRPLRGSPKPPPLKTVAALLDRLAAAVAFYDNEDRSPDSGGASEPGGGTGLEKTLARVRASTAYDATERGILLAFGRLGAT